MSISKRLISLCMLVSLFATSTAMAEAYLIDVRSADEYAEEHANNAEHIPYDEIGEKITELTSDKNDEIFVYCRSGRRAEIAAQTLKDLGYNNVTNLGTLADAQEANITEMPDK
ncbi:rhodanese-like domain-containing protein [Cardiobacteriaceae bacterium TAE3-ERU3]|nr:rhodanese-like domain-containing protein [Cardiobacteriaceae bacterium TAE3-ERU3]